MRVPATLLALFCTVQLLCGCSRGSRENEGAGKNYVCEADTDCRISCVDPADCCGPGCGCSTVVHVQEHADRLKDNRHRCEGKALDCPEYSCQAPTTETIARCQQGTCVGQTRPISHARMEGGFFVDDGAPAPLACLVASDCMGGTTAAENGCCQNPTSLRAYSLAYRKWLAGWRQAKGCSQVTCPPPPAPSMPADCNFEMRCVDSRCTNSCGE